jgi:hypothetical protein
MENGRSRGGSKRLGRHFVYQAQKEILTLLTPCICAWITATLTQSGYGIAHEPGSDGTVLRGHPKPANEGHLKTGQRERGDRRVGRGKTDPLNLRAET